MIEQKFVEHIAKELVLRPEQVAAAIPLFDKGGTVPFVARYRKDVTGNLDEVQLEQIQERNEYFIALTNRRNAILENIAKQEKLTDELRAQIEACFDQTTLEDLYLPFKKQRRTKATVAREQGLEPLAEFIWAQTSGETTIEAYAATFIDAEKGVSSPEEALEGAANILAERISLDVQARQSLRDCMLENGKIKTVATKNAQEQKTKFEDYYEYTEALQQVPSHRFLAVLRGVRMGFLKMDVLIDDEQFLTAMQTMYIKEAASVFAPYLQRIIDDAYKRLLRPAIENEVVGIVRKKADESAIHVFRENAENLLLASPAGRLAVLGVDPGLRTGCKLAVIDDTGAYQESATIYPTPPKQDVEGAAKTVTALLEKYQIKAIAVGNGTGSREVGQFLDDVIQKLDEKAKEGVFTVFVNEAGASIYSASKVARQEFPDLDVTIRGAISIARRLQDPLAELVKIEPRSIGVGQYQHDVNQRRLREGLYKTIESCVNRVGVDLNTASVELLRYVSGIQMGTAQNIVEFRTGKGGITSRKQLMDVPGIGEKTFEQCAGFLRISNGENVLDSTAIHPESYGLVEEIAKELELEPTALIANPTVLEKADFEKYASEEVGAYTLTDIKNELLKPGRDPRSEFRAPRFLSGVHDVKDLEEGMESEGVVTNVTDFGAFVDIGVHQDGLVHLSELANRFVRDPREVVKVGDVIKVKVIKVDKESSRISLSRKALLPVPQKKRGASSATAAPEGKEAERKTSERRKPAARKSSQKKGATRSKQPRNAHARGGNERGKAPDKRGSEKAMNTQLADQLAMLRDKFNQ